MSTPPAAAGRRPGPARMGPGPVPAAFRLRFDDGVRSPAPGVLVGGSPLRVLRLSAAGSRLVEGWMRGQPVGAGRGAGGLAARLVDAGIAHPRPPAAPAPPAVAVVPVRDDPSGLAGTLATLAATAPAVPVVIVDDGSEPPVDRAAPAAVVRHPVNLGPAAARNTGWRAAVAGGHPGPVVFVDAGCRPEPGWLDTITAHFADPGVAAVAPRIVARPAAGASPALAAYEAAHSPLDLGPAEAPVRPGSRVAYVPTAVLAVRREALEQVGGFDPDLRFGEDVDLLWRLDRAGWRIRYEPAARAGHPTRPGLAAWLRQRADYGRSAAPLAARHGALVAPLAASPWSAAAWGFAAAGHPVPAAAIVAGSAAALARRAGPDRATAVELARLAVVGNAGAGGPIASAVRRAWLPPAVLAAAAARRWGPARSRRAVPTALAAALLVPPVADWRRRRPPVGPVRWVALGLADDLAYQYGVWAGALRARSPRALLPRW